MRVRIRLPELLEEHNTTAYEIARQSHGRIDPSQLYRLVRKKGRVELFSASLLEALCEVLDVGPEQLLERGPSRKPGQAKRRRGA